MQEVNNVNYYGENQAKVVYSFRQRNVVLLTLQQQQFQ